MNGPFVNQKLHRFDREAGIAIGPILFIIAVLGILAAAIAAGSGSFSTSTTGESNRTKAAAIIEIGQNLKAAFDRVMGTGIDIANVDVNPNNTSGEYAIFSSTGGGASPPSTTLAATSTAEWYYPFIVYPGIGDSASSTGSRMAVIQVGAGVCYEINLKVNNMNTGAAGNGDVATDNPISGDVTTDGVISSGAWSESFRAKPTGCVYDGTNYYFYQIIGVQ